MLVGFLITGRQHGAAEFASALLMCLGLATLGLADVHADPSHAKPIGFVLLAFSILADATIPNLQERLLRQLNFGTSRMVSAAACLPLLVI